MYKKILSAVMALTLGAGAVCEWTATPNNSFAAGGNGFSTGISAYDERLETIAEAKENFTSLKEFTDEGLSVLYLSADKDDLGWYLHDFFGDETPELFIIGRDINGNEIYSPVEGTKCIIEVYTIYGGELAELIQSTEYYEYFICEEEMIGLITNRQNEYGLDYYNPDGSTADAVSCVMNDDGTKTWLKRNEDDITDTEVTEEEALALIGKYISEFPPASYKSNPLYPPLLGDADGNGVVDSSDASLVLLEYALGSTGSASTLGEVRKKAADVNEDGILDSSDASMILWYYSYSSTGGEISDMREWLESIGNSRD